MANVRVSLHQNEKDSSKEILKEITTSSSSSLESFPNREKWASRWEYLLSLAGIAIGLGNVWRFPYICYKNGGGAFLIPYFLMLALVGLPIFLLESSLGQFSSSGCIAVYEACPALKGIGYTSLLVTLIASTYYSVVIAYPLVFLCFSFWKILPWASCDNPWNTPSCITYEQQFQHSTNQSLENNTLFTTRSPAEEFFHLEILQISPGITQPNGFVYPIVCATICVWVFVFLCIFKGVKVFGKVVWFTSTFPFVMLFVLLVRGLTLPGAMQGIKYFIYPNFSKLANYQVWADAAAQIFFSLQVGWGSLVTMGSYNDYRNNTLRDALWIPILNCATSILAGFVVFSILGFMSFSKNVPVSEVVSAGPSLAFVTYPEALAMMPWAQLWSISFFLMLFFLGVDSCFVQIETMVASLSDEFPKLRHSKSRISFILCLLMLVSSLAYCTQGGMYVLTLLDRYAVAIPISLACLAEVLVFAYSYGGGAVVQDIQQMTNRHLSKFWWACWMVFTPIALVLIATNNIIDITYTETTYNGYIFPIWTESIGWCTALIPVGAIPVVWITTMVSSKGGFWQRLQKKHNPTPKWGPKPFEERLEWHKNCSRQSLKKKFLHPNIVKMIETDSERIMEDFTFQSLTQQKF